VDVPTDAFGVLALVVLVLPGIVWVSVRTAVRGRLANDADVAGRVLQALVISVTLDAVYLLALGPAAVDRLIATADDPNAAGARTTAAAVLVLGVAVPALLAYLVHGEPVWKPVHPRAPKWLKIPRRTTTQQSTPTAWDRAAPELGGRWIRIRLADGKWIGGWYGNGSYISTYPEPHDIYVSDQHDVAADGMIGDQVPGTAGFWVALKDGDIVEWINPPPTAPAGDTS
jgi:hypothetical protein